MLVDGQIVAARIKPGCLTWEYCTAEYQCVAYHVRVRFDSSIDPYNKPLYEILNCSTYYKMKYDKFTNKLILNLHDRGPSCLLIADGE